MSEVLNVRNEALQLFQMKARRANHSVGKLNIPLSSSDKLFLITSLLEVLKYTSLLLFIATRDCSHSIQLFKYQQLL